MMSKKKSKKKLDVVAGILSVMAIVAVFISIINFTVVRKNLDTYRDIASTENINKYQNHYVMIYEGDENEMWHDIYNEANAYAMENNSYVELIGANLSQSYSKNELMEMAILSGADGIIVEGDETDELKKLIRRAREEDIAVVTVLTDAPDSMRNSYIGISSYDMGMMFGNQIRQLSNDNNNPTIDVMVLLNSKKPQSSQNAIFLSLMEEMSNSDRYNIEATGVDNSNSFSVDEEIRDILIGLDKYPDIMVCLSDEITKSAYQGLVEYNKVQNISLLGIASSNEVFEAVNKELVTSVVSVDKKAMGKSCVEALIEYRDTGYVSEYIMIETTLINKDNVGEMINDENEKSD